MHYEALTGKPVQDAYISISIFGEVRLEDMIDQHSKSLLLFTVTFALEGKYLLLLLAF